MDDFIDLSDVIQLIDITKFVAFLIVYIYLCMYLFFYFYWKISSHILIFGDEDSHLTNSIFVEIMPHRVCFKLNLIEILDLNFVNLL